jgi:hypothetical protein
MGDVMEPDVVWLAEHVVLLQEELARAFDLIGKLTQAVNLLADRVGVPR